jgi:hypothetical protein
MGILVNVNHCIDTKANLDSILKLKHAQVDVCMVALVMFLRTKRL